MADECLRPCKKTSFLWIVMSNYLHSLPNGKEVAERRAKLSDFLLISFWLPHGVSYRQDRVGPSESASDVDAAMLPLQQDRLTGAAHAEPTAAIDFQVDGHG